jgi:hypothetical protein
MLVVVPKPLFNVLDELLKGQGASHLRTFLNVLEPLLALLAIGAKLASAILVRYELHCSCNIVHMLCRPYLK